MMYNNFRRVAERLFGYKNLLLKTDFHISNDAEALTIRTPTISYTKRRN